MFPSLDELSRKNPVEPRVPVPDLMPNGEPWPSVELKFDRQGGMLFIGGHKDDYIGSTGYEGSKPIFCIPRISLNITIEKFFPNMDPVLAKSFLLHQLEELMGNGQVPIEVHPDEEAYKRVENWGKNRVRTR